MCLSIHAQQREAALRTFVGACWCLFTFVRSLKGCSAESRAALFFLLPAPGSQNCRWHTDSAPREHTGAQVRAYEGPPQPAKSVQPACLRVIFFPFARLPAYLLLLGRDCKARAYACRPPLSLVAMRHSCRSGATAVQPAPGP